MAKKSSSSSTAQKAPTAPAVITTYGAVQLRPQQFNDFLQWEGMKREARRREAYFREHKKALFKAAHPGARLPAHLRNPKPLEYERMVKVVDLYEAMPEGKKKENFLLEVQRFRAIWLPHPDGAVKAPSEAI